MEYRIGARVVQRHDFLEGVRAVIVEKDNAPKLEPADAGGRQRGHAGRHFRAPPFR